VGPLGPDIEKHPIDVPGLTAANGDLASSLKPVSGEALTFQAAAGERQLTFVPFDRLFRERYSIYWRVS